MILVWAVASVIYAFIIHVLFSLYPSNDWLIAKWTAGEILTYASTVSLGLLAVWQNRKIQSENDKAQSRLEDIINKSNELEILGKIVKYESDNLIRLRAAFDEFSRCCDPQYITEMYAKNLNSNGGDPLVGIMNAMVQAERELDGSFFALSRELRMDGELKADDKDLLKNAFRDYYITSKKMVAYIRDNPKSSFDDKIMALLKIRDQFVEQREKYMMQQEAKMNKLLYENLSIEEIKQLYHRENGLGD